MSPRRAGDMLGGVIQATTKIPAPGYAVLSHPSLRFARFCRHTRRSSACFVSPKERYELAEKLKRRALLGKIQRSSDLALPIPSTSPTFRQETGKQKPPDAGTGLENQTRQRLEKSWPSSPPFLFQTHNPARKNQLNCSLRQKLLDTSPRPIPSPVLVNHDHDLAKSSRERIGLEKRQGLNRSPIHRLLDAISPAASPPDASCLSQAPDPMGSPYGPRPIG
ncbi:hypothetical protein V8C43DRAFT_328394 [Trichoderma afarasin]